MNGLSRELLLGLKKTIRNYNKGDKDNGHTKSITT